MFSFPGPSQSPFFIFLFLKFNFHSSNTTESKKEKKKNKKLVEFRLILYAAAHPPGRTRVGSHSTGWMGAIFGSENQTGQISSYMSFHLFLFLLNGIYSRGILTAMKSIIKCVEGEGGEGVMGKP
eukprot:TRINITY_DN38903_c0_g1_i1.p1 TRINITY_DN38903_c0_g1~~TRINITY_DN38903_c0_g1_i1.p1  ORF type:complete len:125 (-),score=0.96 TRINITY_DN38903_c0_g1_i1:26-400(-)